MTRMSVVCPVLNAHTVLYYSSALFSKYAVQSVEIMTRMSVVCPERGGGSYMGRVGQPGWPSQNKIIIILLLIIIIIIIMVMMIIIFCYKREKNMTVLSGLNTLRMCWQQNTTVPQ